MTPATHELDAVQAEVDGDRSQRIPYREYDLAYSSIIHRYTWNASSGRKA